MQIDFHHTVTYVCSRLAGFEHNEAEKIAYAAQYVDDATNSGVIKFTNNAMYNRISSAHSTFDFKNHFNQYENHLVWVPFHFLPGNGGKMAGENPEGSFIEKLVCYPDSPIANDVLAACIKDSDKSYSLQRLGITMHVFADTFAHQSFAGILHDINKIEDLTLHNEDQNFFDKMKADAANKFPMGHGPALTCPDKPYLEWEYVNEYHSEPIVRNNTEIFMNAVHNLVGHLGNYLYQVERKTVPDEVESDYKKIEENFKTFREQSGEERHERWLKSIADGDFSFGAQKLEYKAKGIGSWKHQAIGQDKSRDEDSDEFEYSNDFLSSDWKLFHDALQAHRFDVIHDILPRYGICAG
jgi:hypothetical protein